MEILSNKEDLINELNTIYEEIINMDCNVSLVTKSIKSRLLKLGSQMFEHWFNKNIGTGYKGYKLSMSHNNKNEVLKFHSYIKKNYLTCLGEVSLKRAYYRNNDVSCYPIENENAWLKNPFLPDVQEMCCYVSMLEPYDMASKILDKVGDIKVSPASMQTITKKIGSQLVEMEDNAIESGEINNLQNDPDLLVISTDGACVNTLNEWKEVKSGAVYEVKKTKNKDNEDVIQAKNKSYVSRIENSHDFGKRLFLEARRRNVNFADQVVTIGDGAKWIWKMFKKYYPNSIQIVDWYHATEHLWKIIELLFGNKTNDKAKEFEKKCEEYLFEGWTKMLEECILKKMEELNIFKSSARVKEIKTELKYFIGNEAKMKYSEFRAKGFPIGSGVIEGACKHLVQIRMKRNGMKWTENGAHDILQLRCLYFSNRWNEVENIIEKGAA